MVPNRRRFIYAGTLAALGLGLGTDGTRLYFSSQRGIDGKTGMTFEVTGPF